MAWAQQTTYTLDVITTEGGIVSSSPAGIACGTTCSSSYTQGSNITLSAQAQRGFIFSGWTGDCSGNDKTTRLTLNNDSQCYAVFTALPPDAMVQISVNAYSTGDSLNTSCAVHADGRATCWGDGYLGLLGNGDVRGCEEIPYCGHDSYQPVYVLGISTAFSLDTGGVNSYIVLEDGTALALGFTPLGGIGDGFALPDGHRRTPVRVGTTSSVVQVSSGGGHACAVLPNGEVFCWGWAQNGRLGQGESNVNSPIPIRVPGITSAVGIDVGFDEACAVLASGNLTCWGGVEGQGTPEPKFHNSLTTVVDVNLGAENDPNDNTMSVPNHKCVLLADSTIKCWGNNGHGQVGSSSTSPRVDSPTQVVGITTAVRDINTGHYHTCAVLKNGGIKCWGLNTDGQLGNGTFASTNRAVSVLGISTAVGVSAGESHTCAVLEDGFAKCWGNKTRSTGSREGSPGGNALGNGTMTPQDKHHTPVTVIVPDLSLNDTVVTQTAIINSLFAFTPQINGLAHYWSIENKPQWTTFSTRTGTLYGVASGIGSHSGIVIHAYSTKTIVTMTTSTVIDGTRTRVETITTTMVVPTTATYGPFSLIVENVTIIQDADNAANTIVETAAVGTPISHLSLRVVDGSNMQLFGLTWGFVENPDDVFAIDPMSGEVTLAEATALDHETSPSRTIVVSVSSAGIRLASMTVSIAVQDALEISDTDSAVNTVAENAKMNTAVDGLDLRITDTLETVRWTLTEDAGGLFWISSTSGAVSVSGRSSLDYESTPSHILVAVVTATKSGSVSLTSTLTITVQVIDVLEQLTVVDADPRPPEWIRENQASGTVISHLLLQARDEEDRPLSSGVIWSLKDDSNNLFMIDSAGIVRANPVDHESTRSTIIVITAQASKSGNVTLTGTLTVTITVTNVLERIAIFDLDSTASNTIAEGALPGSTVSGLRIDIRRDESDESLIPDRQAVIEGTTLSQVFGMRYIDDTGYWALAVEQNLPPTEDKSSYILKIVVEHDSDSALMASNLTVTGMLTVTVTVLDVDSLTLIDALDTANTIAEDASSGTAVSGLSLQAMDNLGYIQSGVRWNIYDDPSGLFAIGLSDGVVRFASTQSLDYERITSYTIVVSATSVLVGATGIASITIAVMDVLETVTIVDSNRADNTLYENAVTGTVVNGLSLQAMSEGSTDSSITIQWSLTDDQGLFAIDSMNGEVSLTTASLNYETSEGGSTSHAIVVSVVATRNGETVTQMQTITIAVQDVLEKLTIRDTDDADNLAEEDATMVMGVNLQAESETGEALSSVAVRWTLTALDIGGVISTDLFERTSTGALSIVSSSALDYEATSSVQIVVVAAAQSGGADLSATMTLTVTVQNVFDLLGFVASGFAVIAENAVTGTAVRDLNLEIMSDADPSLPLAVMWSLVNNGGGFFEINSTSGQITLSTVGIDYEANSLIVLEVVATGVQDGRTVRQSARINVNLQNVLETVTISDTNTAVNIIAENAPIGTIVSNLRLQALNDRNLASGFTREWSVPDRMSLFSFSNRSVGELNLQSASLNYEVSEGGSTSHTVVVRVVITQGDISVMDEQMITIVVQDVLEQLTISAATNTGTVIEDQAGATVFGLDLMVVGENANPLTSVVWQVTSNTNFEIDTASGALRLKPDVMLDYETSSDRVHTLVVSVSAEKGGVMKTASTEVTIILLNALDGLIITDTDGAGNTISEDAITGTVVSGLNLRVTDENEVPVTGAVWTLVSAADRLFTINSTSGVISLAKAMLDYETSASHSLVVQSTLASQVASITLVVVVQDVLEALTISGADSTATVVEASTGATVSGLNLMVMGENANALSSVSWTLTDTNFEISLMTGIVKLQSGVALDYETPSDRVHTLIVSVSAEKGGVSLSESVTVTVLVQDVFEGLTINDEGDDSRGTVVEGSTGVVVDGLNLMVVDEDNSSDAFSSISWTLTDMRFAISSMTGVVKLQSGIALDYETSSQHILIVNVSAEKDGEFLTDSATLTILVIDVLESLAISDEGDDKRGTVVEGSTGAVVEGLNLMVAGENTNALSSVSWQTTDTVFAIGSMTGVVRLQAGVALDYETSSDRTYAVVVSVSAEKGGVSLTVSVTLTISVEDVLEALSVVDGDGADNLVSEGAAVGTTVTGLSLQVSTEAVDTLSDVMVAWNLIGHTSGWFTISADGEVRVAAELDYETNASTELIVMVSGTKGGVTRSDSVTVTITLTNLLEAVNITDSDRDTNNTIAENASANTAVAGLSLVAADESGVLLESGVMWNITPTNVFTINASGEVRVSSTAMAPLDYEMISAYTVVVSVVASRDGVTVTGNLSVTIMVSDVLESVSVIDQQNNVSNTLTLNATSGTAVGGLRLQAQDEASQELSMVTWSLSSTDSALFSISQDGVVRWSSDNSPSTADAPYRLVVQASGSKGGVSMSGSLILRIAVLSTRAGSIEDTDASTNSVQENALQGTVVSGFRVRALDGNSNPLSNVTWRLDNDAGGLFAINTASGEVSVAGGSGLDYESSTHHQIEVSALDGNLLVDDVLTVIIEVENLLEEVRITDSDRDTNNTIAENAGANTAVAGLSLAAADESGAPLQSGVMWNIMPTNVFTINASGEVRVSSTATAPLDYEMISAYTVVVSAVASRDGVTVTGNLSVTIMVSDVLESVSVIDQQNNVSNTLTLNATSGTAVGGLRLQAQDEASQELSMVTWSLSSTDSALFSISQDGVVRWSSDNSPSTTDAPYRLVVQASGSKGGVSMSGSLILRIVVLSTRAGSIEDTDASTNSVQENALQGTVVSGFRVRALDGNSNPLSNVTWRLDNDAGGLFAINTASGEVSVAGGSGLDYESSTHHQIEVSALDGNLLVDDVLTVIIEVENLLEEVRITDSDRDTNNTIAENAGANTAVAGLSLAAADESGAPLQSGVMWNITPTNFFAINATSGEVSLSSTATALLDYEMTSAYTVVVSAVASRDGQTVSNTLEVSILLVDLLESLTISDEGNDNRGTVIEESTGATVNGLNLAVAGENPNALSLVSWQMTDTTTFEIDSVSGVVKLRSGIVLDYETPSDRAHTVSVRVSAEKGGASVTASVSLTILVVDLLEVMTVTDTNIAQNIIRKGSATVTGTEVSGLSLQAQDEAVNALTADWNLVDNGNGLFAINSETGVVSVADTDTLQATQAPQVDIIVRAIASKGGITMTDMLTVNITIQPDAVKLRLRLFLEGPLQ